jgi:hypothetical protein
VRKLKKELLKIINSNHRGISWEYIKKKYCITGIEDKKFDCMQDALTGLSESRKIRIEWIPCQGTNLYSSI